jgi:hypothetical protein
VTRSLVSVSPVFLQLTLRGGREVVSRAMGGHALDVGLLPTCGLPRPAEHRTGLPCPPRHLPEVRRTTRSHRLRESCPRTLKRRFCPGPALGIRASARDETHGRGPNDQGIGCPSRCCCSCYTEVLRPFPHREESRSTAADQTRIVGPTCRLLVAGSSSGRWGARVRNPCALARSSRAAGHSA